MARQRKDAKVMAVTARAHFGIQKPEEPQHHSRAPGVDLLRDAILFDPDRPHLGPNELYEELKRQGGGRINMQHLQYNCPFCNKDFPHNLWVSHMNDNKEGKGCRTRNHSTMDIIHRKFSGASLADAGDADA